MGEIERYSLQERAVLASRWRWCRGIVVRMNDGPLDWSRLGVVETVDAHASDEADGSDIRLVAGHAEWRWRTYDEGGEPRTPFPFEMPVPVLQHPATKGIMLNLIRDVGYGRRSDAYVRKVSEDRWSVFDTDWMIDLPLGVHDLTAGWPVHHGETEEEALVVALEDGQ